MARRSTWRAAAASGALGLLAATPGCTPVDTHVLVAGIDADGTPVVAASSCGHELRPLEAVTVSDLGTPGVPVTWQIDQSAMGASTTGPPPPVELAPPPSNPTRLGPVPLITIGDPAPDDWVTTTPLEGTLPSEGRLRIEFHEDALDSSASETFTLDLDGGADRYQYIAGGSAGFGVTADQAARVLFEECDDTSTFDGGRFLVVAGVGGAVLVGFVVLVGVVTARQYRRAGEGPTRA